MLSISQVQCDYLTNPIGLDKKEPVFGWKIYSDRKNTYQQAYQIVVHQGVKVIWDSGRIESGRTFAIPYEGESLVSRTEYRYRILIWDDADHQTESEEHTFETAFLMKKTGLPHSWNPIH